jgi:hypothetical protein
MSATATDVELMTPEEVAAHLRRGLRTLANWRCRGFGPAFYRTGARVVYARADVDDWLARNRASGDIGERPEAAPAA